MIDIESLLVAWLEETIEDVHASTETPADLDDRLDWILVRRIGGPYDGFRLDRPSVDIATFSASGSQAAALGLQVQLLLHTQLERSSYAGAVISDVTTNTGPHWVPYDNPAMRRYEANYSLVVHPA